MCFQYFIDSINELWDTNQYESWTLENYWKPVVKYVFLNQNSTCPDMARLHAATRPCKEFSARKDELRGQGGDVDGGGWPIKNCGKHGKIWMKSWEPMGNKPFPIRLENLWAHRKCHQRWRRYSFPPTVILKHVKYHPLKTMVQCTDVLNQVNRGWWFHVVFKFETYLGVFDPTYFSGETTHQKKMQRWYLEAQRSTFPRGLIPLCEWAQLCGL